MQVITSKRQEGSHIVMRRDDPFAQVIVPNHKELDRGTLRAIIRQAGLSSNEFLKLALRYFLWLT